MNVDLYYAPSCPGCRSILMLLKAMDLPIKTIQVEIDSFDKFLKEEFTVPRLIDNGDHFTDSQLILTYLMDQYATTSSKYLYPGDPKRKSSINQRLYFDAAKLTPAFKDYYFPELEQRVNSNTENRDRLEQAMRHLNSSLSWQPYVAGDTVTIADYSMVTTVSTMEVCGFDIRKYANVVPWLRRLENTIPGYEEINVSGCYEFKKLLDHALGRY